MSARNLITYNIFIGLLSIILIYPAIGQDENYAKIERVQDEIEDLYVKTYTIFEAYPNLTYEYIYDEDEVTSVQIVGVPNVKDRKKLEVYMMDIADYEHEIFNQANRTGVYYVSEKEPKPIGGFDEFYSQIKQSINTSDIKTFQNYEGSIYAKFVVDDKGEIDNVILTSTFENKDSFVVEEMKKDTKEAILATSGSWKPATIGGIPVPQWMVLPVQFDEEENFYSPLR